LICIQLIIFAFIQPQSTKKPVVTEQYDEIVFNDPTENFYKKLLKVPILRKSILPHPKAGVSGAYLA
jgi:hypothetical protein